MALAGKRAVLLSTTLLRPGKPDPGAVGGRVSLQFSSCCFKGDAFAYELMVLEIVFAINRGNSPAPLYERNLNP